MMACCASMRKQVLQFLGSCALLYGSSAEKSGSASLGSPEEVIGSKMAASMPEASCSKFSFPDVIFELGVILD